MPDTSIPEPIGDYIEQTAGGLFGSGLDDPILTLKCRYLFLIRRIQTRQDNDRSVPESWMQKNEELEEALMEADIRPSSLIET